MIQIKTSNILKIKKIKNQCHLLACAPKKAKQKNCAVSFQRQYKLFTNLYTKYKMYVDGVDLYDMITLHTTIGENHMNG